MDKNSMQDFISIVDVLQKHAQDYPNDIAIKFLTQKGYETLTYSELNQRAKKLAAVLQSYDTHFDERAVILLPPSLDYIIAFFACLYAGVIAVPIYPPRKNQHKNRVFAVLEDSQAKFVITNESLANEFPNYTVINIDSNTTKKANNKYLPVAIEPNKIVFLQYTSGSTSTPKGVLINHMNLMANIKVIMDVFTPQNNNKISSWLPPYHDMGLIGCVLTPIYKKRELILLSPTYFLHSPIRWLEIISQERITATCVPNFAFDYCVKKISDAQVAQLDLSSLRCIYNGSEPIQFDSIQRFIKKFKAAGLSQDAIYPCYGLAEATLMLTAKQYKESDVALKLNKSEFELGKISITAETSNEPFVQIVNCGDWPSDHPIRIIDPNTLIELPEQSIGEIWASGPSIAKGYWNKMEQTQAAFKNQLPDSPNVNYLRTGDLGFIYQNNLYVTGRIKDLLIIRGKNYYPHDIEQIITKSRVEFESLGAAAFTIEVDREQELVILQELTREAMNQIETELLFSSIQATLLDQFGLVPCAIVLVRPFTLPKTSSGKIQRWLARTAFLDNSLKSIANWEKVSVNPQHTMTLTSSAEEIKAWLTDWLMRRLNMVLTQDDYEKSISTLGINSIAAVELANELQIKLDKKVELLPLFEHYSLNQLIAILSEETPATHLNSINTFLTEFKEEYFLNTETSYTDSAHLTAPPLTFGLRNLIHNIESSAIDDEVINHLKNIYFNINEGISRDTTVIDGTQYINYSGYNYLGLSGDPRVTEAVINAVKKFGTSVSASRLVSGEKAIHRELEQAIAGLIGVDDCLVLPSGYATNVTIITHLFGKNDLILHDELAHNSILHAALFSGADRIAFPHNNYQFLNNFLTQYRDKYRKVLLVTEGIFSMDGDIADVPQLIALKKQFNVFLMIDEAHSMGVLGKTGKGIREYYHLNSHDVDIWMGTLSKSFASCGGYIAGTHELIESFKYTSAGFVYSAGISPANTAAALAAIEVMQREPQRLTFLRERHSLLWSLLKEQQVATGLSINTPIIPIVVGKDSAAIQLSDYLRANGILALPIVYPAVEKNLARVRLFVNCLHTEEQIYHTANVLRKSSFFANKNSSCSLEVV